MNNQELTHFGVKGMRWGHRKAQDSSSSSNRSNGGKDSSSNGGNGKQDSAIKLSARRARKLEKLKIAEKAADTRIGDLAREANALPFGLKKIWKGNLLGDELVKQAYRQDAIESIENGRLTANQELLIVGATTTALLIATKAIKTKANSYL